MLRTVDLKVTKNFRDGLRVIIPDRFVGLRGFVEKKTTDRLLIIIPKLLLGDTLLHFFGLGNENLRTFDETSYKIKFDFIFHRPFPLQFGNRKVDF